MANLETETCSVGPLNMPTSSQERYGKLSAVQSPCPESCLDNVDDYSRGHNNGIAHKLTAPALGLSEVRGVSMVIKTGGVLIGCLFVV